MKYLHSTPVRAHGYLTSRNCVIDARWVLKVTDYGLPAFYEAQNAILPTKTARGEFILSIYLRLYRERLVLIKKKYLRRFSFFRILLWRNTLLAKANTKNKRFGKYFMNGLLFFCNKLALVVSVIYELRTTCKT